MNINKIILFNLIAGILFLPGCTHKVRVYSSSIFNADASKRFIVKKKVFIDCPLRDNTLFNKELSAKIARHLNKFEFNETQDLKCAENYLVFNYETQSEKKIRHIPIYTPGKVHFTTGNINVPTRSRTGNFTAYGTDTVNYNQTTQETGAIYFVPQNYTEFTHLMKISIYDNKNINKDSIIWHGAATVISENPSFRTYSDYLLFSLFNKFGKSSEGIVTESFTRKKLESYWSKDKK